jgi:hypothetical protein
MGIQGYIFGTNQLKQNVGASYLVDCSTRNWVAESLPKPHNVIDPQLESLHPFTNQTIENDNLAAEVVYAGGGNTMIIFASLEDAISFSRHLTSKILCDAHGLEVVLVHKEFDWQGEKALGGESGVVSCAMKMLALKKANHFSSSPILGLGVTAACAFTGLPAVGYDDEKTNRLISTEVEAKLNAAHYANERLERLIKFGCWKPARKFEDLGSTYGESSYVAVVHTDGNSMAKRIQKIRDEFSRSSQNREYIKKMRSFSLCVQ